MMRHMSYATRVLAAAAVLALPATSVAQDNRPVVVVFTFTNSSIGSGRADFDGVSTGIQDLLITDLASNDKIRLVDRARIHEIVQEHELAKSGAIDPQTAVRFGRMLGAQYAVTGGFMSDGKGNLVLTGRTIDIETTQIANPQKITGKADDVLGAIAQLSKQLSSNMNLAPKPGAERRTGDAGAAKSTPASSGAAQTGNAKAASAAPAVDLYAKPVTKAESMKVKLDAPTLKIYSNALDEMDKKNNAKAVELLKEVLAKFPSFEPAERNLRKLGAA